MKLLTPLAAIIAAASAGQIYNNQPAQNYINSADIYQSAAEHQQQGIYSDQSHAYAQNAAYNSRPSAEKTAKILSYVSENNGHQYQYSFETDNGIKAQEVGQTHKGSEAHGAYSYTGDDGQVYTVSYVADEHGFRAQGHHLPTPPPIPEAILKSLEHNAKEEAAGIFDDGQYKGQAVAQQPAHAYQYEPAYQQEYQPQVQAHQQEYQPQVQAHQQEYQPQVQVHGADLAYHGHH